MPESGRVFEAFEGAAEHLETLADFVRFGASRFEVAGLFFGHGTDNAVDESLTLVLHALHLAPGLASELFHARLLPFEKARILSLFRQRIERRVPAPYLTHEAWFAGLPFFVDERVLVPRSPIAELVTAGFSPWWGPRPPSRILDLCTGSGCIAIACAHAFPEAQVDASDISPEALEVAGENVARHGLGERVSLLRSNLFEELPRARYDLIVSNPPYVDTTDLAKMPEEFHREPRLGLAAGADGLDAVRRILRDAATFMASEALLVVEVGESRPALERAYPDLPFLWPDFERGGRGVFLLNAEALPDR